MNDPPCPDVPLHAPWHRPLGARTRTWLRAALVAAFAQAAGAQEAAPSVVVTATRHEVLEREAPAALSVVTRREIEMRGADNLLDALRAEPGVSLQGRAIGGRKVLSLRGMDSKHTLFLVDGRRIGASDGVIGHSDFQYDWIAVEDIERIEVVRGPLSVLYGSEAMGGVVNVITREPAGHWQFGATAEGSRAQGDRGGDGRRLSMRADGPLGGGFLLRAGAAATRVDVLASSADPRISELEGRDKDDAWLGLGWRGGGGEAAGQRVDLEHRAGREERLADARERSGKRRYHQTFNDIERSLTSLGWEADWGATAGLPAWTSQLRAYRASVDVVNRRTEGVAVNPPQRIEDRVLEGLARAVLGRHGLSVGFEARDESLDDPGLPGGSSVARNRALFVQDEWALARALNLTLGLRHDQNQLYGDEWSPRLYGVWQPSPAWTVKGGYSHGFKAPNLKQIVPGSRAEGPNTFHGNPALQPERSDGLELGAGFAAGPTELQVTLYDQRVQGLIEVRLLAAGAVPGIGTYTYENLARARMRGVEAALAQGLGAGFTARLNYAYLDARTDSGQRLEKRPRHGAAAQLDWHGGPWGVNAYAEYSGDQLMPSPTAGAAAVPVPSITLVGAQVSHALPWGLRLALGVQNLGDVRLAERSPLFTHVEPPRTWRLTLRGSW